MNIDQKVFKAYDIRGVYPTQINADVAYRVGQAYAKFTGAKQVAVGRDVRTSGPELVQALSQGFLDHGVNVIDIGVITTDMYYFAVANYGYDGGIMTSASHNPREFNGFKMVRKDAIPLSGDNGIPEIKELVLSGYKYQAEKKGSITKQVIIDDYIKKCLTFADLRKVKKLKIVVNAMFGPIYRNIEKLNLPIDIVPINEKPDGNFPKGAPDPLLEENRIETSEKIKEVHADLGAAWDADADRFFLFDENGRWIPGYYLTAFLGEHFCEKIPGAKIIFDPRAVWATIDAVKRLNGLPLMNKAGHSFFKDRMRKEDAVFAGEMSGHYYFKDFFYADNGLIPFIILLEIISESGLKTSELLNRYFEQYHMSGEINFNLSSIEQSASAFNSLKEKYSDAKIDYTDGISIEYSDWRANLRPSNTQSLIRLNIEAKSSELLKQKVNEISLLIQN